ncbi:MAG TPA: cytochrome C biogenesis protein [Candidatus Nealsonbacteria bacterium]|uniref:Cytochrome C biogenesis protein transmembrane domain-containing protein n=1 Tax=marine sediment metagenome TaxID=412755 RepID=A0A0F9V185_9ZZZZ|nr:cytochrome C biogenesis protein [Candidatus Nealsonbacteria bacterium]HEB46723.1 cytochrome C biogenesis protein [Candidatus Nealsonbacteria bacterium]
MNKEPALTEFQKKTRVPLVVAFFILTSIFLIGIFWLAFTPGQTVGLTLAFAAGLSMIFLPCTLPLAFVIVPLSMGRGYKKGLLMALFFGLGLSITLAIYGTVIAWAGKLFGLDRATQIMFFVAGLAAFSFGLSELKLLKFKIPGFSAATPKWIQKKGSYLKSFFLGFFLGNAGVGCPNPAFYVLLAYIASTGSLAYGGWLGFIHGAGRAVPLIALSILGILGINATGWIVKKKVTVDKVMGWALVIIGAFIFINGLPGGHQWYEETFIHQGWNRAVEVVGLPAELEMDEHKHIEQPFQKFIPWIFFSLIFIPIIWNKLRKTKVDT